MNESVLSFFRSQQLERFYRFMLDKPFTRYKVALFFDFSLQDASTWLQLMQSFNLVAPASALQHSYRYGHKKLWSFTVITIGLFILPTVSKTREKPS